MDRIVFACLKHKANPLTNVHASPPLSPEFGDCADVRRVFGFRESFTYHLFKTGQIKGVLIPGTGKKGGTGKRLFSFASIRTLIANQQAKQAKSVPKETPEARKPFLPRERRSSIDDTMSHPTFPSQPVKPVRAIRVAILAEKYCCNWHNHVCVGTEVDLPTGLQVQ